VSQEECARLREGVPYVKIYRYNPKHLCPKLNGGKPATNRLNYGAALIQAFITCQDSFNDVIYFYYMYDIELPQSEIKISGGYVIMSCFQVVNLMESLEMQEWITFEAHA
jgi:hypothetical protein